MRVRTKQFLAVSVGLIVGGVMILLGLWQGARYQASIEDVAGQRAQEPAVALAEHVHADGNIDDIYGRQVTAQGTMVPDLNLLVGTEYPMRYVNAFQLDDGRYLAVVLGEVPSGAGPILDWIGRSHEITGVFTSGDPALEGSVPEDAPDGSMTSLRLQQLAQRWPDPLIAGYITLNAADSEANGLLPAEAVLPEQEGSGMHRGYALQWWVFAGAAVVFGVIVARGFREDRTAVTSAPR